MTSEERKIIDTSLDQARTLHDNLRGLWDGDTLAAFYYSVISGTMARSGPEVAQALGAMLTEVYANTAKSHVDLGRLTSGFPDNPSPPTNPE